LLLGEPVAVLRVLSIRDLWRTAPFALGHIFVIAMPQQSFHLAMSRAFSAGSAYSVGALIGTLFWIAVFLYVWVRLGVRLPAVAIGDSAMTVRRTWSIADPVAGQVFIGVMGVIVPFLAAHFAVAYLGHLSPLFLTATARAVLTPVYLLLALFALLVSATFFTFTYRTLSGGGISSVFE
jgi:hypothetical protein